MVVDAGGGARLADPAAISRPAILLIVMLLRCSDSQLGRRWPAVEMQSISMLCILAPDWYNATCFAAGQRQLLGDALGVGLLTVHLPRSMHLLRTVRKGRWSNRR